MDLQFPTVSYPAEAVLVALPFPPGAVSPVVAVVAVVQAAFPFRPWVGLPAAGVEVQVALPFHRVVSFQHLGSTCCRLRMVVEGETESPSATCFPNPAAAAGPAAGQGHPESHPGCHGSQGNYFALPLVASFSSPAVASLAGVVVG